MSDIRGRYYAVKQVRKLAPEEGKRIDAQHPTDDAAAIRAYEAVLRVLKHNGGKPVKGWSPSKGSAVVVVERAPLDIAGTYPVERDERYAAARELIDPARRPGEQVKHGCKPLGFAPKPSEIPVDQRILRYPGTKPARNVGTNGWSMSGCVVIGHGVKDYSLDRKVERVATTGSCPKCASRAVRYGRKVPCFQHGGPKVDANVKGRL